MYETPTSTSQRIHVHKIQNLIAKLGLLYLNSFMQVKGYEKNESFFFSVCLKASNKQVGFFKKEARRGQHHYFQILIVYRF